MQSLQKSCSEKIKLKVEAQIFMAFFFNFCFSNKNHLIIFINYIFSLD